MLPRYWRLSEQRYRLQGMQCPVCGKMSLLRRPVCCVRGTASADEPDSSEYALLVADKVDPLQASACMLPGAVIRAEIHAQLEKL
jgi:uncharacterized OB-fold protein